MVETFKYKSKFATAIGAVATIISVLGVDQLQALFPSFGQYIPAVVALATWWISQSTENTRVEVAEQMVREEYENQEFNAGDIPITVNLTADDIMPQVKEYIDETYSQDNVEDSTASDDIVDDGGA